MKKIPVAEASLLPRCTGVYLFSDRHGNILYVGKAKDLRRRVAQHIREGRSRAPLDRAQTRRKRLLMAAAHEVAWLPADTELLALLLEESLIKEYRPAYNRRQNKFSRQVYLLFDEKTHSVRITDRPEPSGCHGPFSDRFYALKLAAVLDERFGISPPSGGGFRGKASDAARAERFLTGYDDGLIRSLKEEIERLSAELRFERAAAVRDELYFCRKFLRRQAFIRLFVSGALILSETHPARGSDHYLFHRGRLSAHASPDIPGAWGSGAGLTEAVSPEPEPAWLLSERALVVYTWLRTDRNRKSVRILRAADRSSGTSSAAPSP